MRRMRPMPQVVPIRGCSREYPSVIAARWMSAGNGGVLSMSGVACKWCIGRMAMGGDSAQTTARS